MSEYITVWKDHEPTKLRWGVPVVRCRDCRYYELQTVSYSSEPLSVCTAEWCEGAEHDNPLVEPDGFCAWGEREIWTMCKCGEEIELGNREFAVCPSCGRTVRE